MVELTIKDAEEWLLGIIQSVRDGITMPEEAVNEVGYLNDVAPKGFTVGNYTLEDFQRIRADGLSEYEVTEHD